MIKKGKARAAKIENNEVITIDAYAEGEEEEEGASDAEKLEVLPDEASDNEPEEQSVEQKPAQNGGRKRQRNGGESSKGRGKEAEVLHLSRHNLVVLIPRRHAHYSTVSRLIPVVPAVALREREDLAYSCSRTVIKVPKEGRTPSEAKKEDVRPGQNEKVEEEEEVKKETEEESTLKRKSIAGALAPHGMRSMLASFANGEFGCTCDTEGLVQEEVHRICNTPFLHPVPLSSTLPSKKEVRKAVASLRESSSWSSSEISSEQLSRCDFWSRKDYAEVFDPEHLKAVAGEAGMPYGRSLLYFLNHPAHYKGVEHIDVWYGRYLGYRRGEGGAVATPFDRSMNGPSESSEEDVNGIHFFCQDVRFPGDGIFVNLVDIQRVLEQLGVPLEKKKSAGGSSPEAQKLREKFVKQLVMFMRSLIVARVAAMIEITKLYTGPCDHRKLEELSQWYVAQPSPTVFLEQLAEMNLVRKGLCELHFAEIDDPFMSDEETLSTVRRSPKFLWLAAALDGGDVSASMQSAVNWVKVYISRHGRTMSAGELAENRLK